MIALLLLAATPAAAQSADFLFRKPSVTFGVRGGWAVPRAQSEIFVFTTEQLTVDRSDLGGLAFQADLAARVRDRLDVILSVGHSRSAVLSEFRAFVDTDDLPIEQTTRFQRTPVTIGVKAYLQDRGRSVSRFAWVPSAWATYVGAGVGLMVYEFTQRGEFVDHETLDVFGKDFQSRGTTPAAHLTTGLELSIGPKILATAEAGYLWSRTDMSRDFVDFDRIDLSGFQITVGVSARF
jgi:hypothetical protein